MIKISCYHSTENQLPKTFCQLVEKCYYSDLETIVFTQNKNYSQELDRVLWTYSRRHFIPHATSSDPMPEKQPILITEDITNYTPAKTIIFVNATEPSIINTLSKERNIELQNTEKILFLFDEMQKIQSPEIETILKETCINKFTINSFYQTKRGSWQETPIL